MADPTEILVKSDPSTTQTKGDWVLKIGRGRGGKIVSRHRQKSQAVEKGRQKGRARADRSGGAVLKVQDKQGHWSTEARYGDAQDEGGFLGLF